MKRAAYLIFAALIFSFITVSAQAGEIHLSVAASLTDAFKEMFADFSKTHNDVQFIPNFGGSGTLAKQIDQGAPADIFVSADQKWMKFLVEKKAVVTDSVGIFVRNQLVFVGIDKGAALDMAKLPTLKQIAIGAPESVPAGAYAKQVLEKAGIYVTMEADKKLVLAKDVRQALMYADRGEVDGAFVYKTDALLAKEAKILFTVPDNMLSTSIECPAALTVKGVANADATAFFTYMKSGAASAILKKYGFVPAQ